MTTLYDILGVPEDAAPEQIKQAYRRAAMQSHPDRNAGREVEARARFQRVKEAYAILSDPAQRRVYDAVYAEELARLQALKEEGAEAPAASRDDKADADAEAHYAACVSLAMRLAERGHGRDVLFGAMLARECDDLLAARIADGVAALHGAHDAPARTDDVAGEQRDDATDEPAKRTRAPAYAEGRGEVSDEMSGEVSEEGSAAVRDDAAQAPVAGQGRADSPPVGGLFATLWHGLFGLRP